MTCIVVLKEKDKIYLGGDSFCGDEDGIAYDRVIQPKVFTRGEFHFAFCGDFRVFNIIRYEFKPPRPGKNIKDIHEWLVIKFIPELRKAFETSGYKKKHDDVETFGDEDTDIMVVIRGRMFIIYSDFSTFEVRHYYSIGAGAHFALGAIHTISDMNIPPRERVERALKAADHWSNLVCEPYHIIEIDTKKKELSGEDEA